MPPSTFHAETRRHEGGLRQRNAVRHLRAFVCSCVRVNRFPGATPPRRPLRLFVRHSREGGNQVLPRSTSLWVPAFAGMTIIGGKRAFLASLREIMRPRHGALDQVNQMG